MKTPCFRKQAGYALILVVLGLMGIGGVVLAGFTQQAKEDVYEQRYEHNKRVLEQAKQALLMFAYNYPATNGGGPGRLLCPDEDNDGNTDNPTGCNQIGRFPYLDARLNTHRLLDASGETLWYAVSDAFDNVAGGGVINSDTIGTITVLDQSGDILYDGAAAGIAVIQLHPGYVSTDMTSHQGTPVQQAASGLIARMDELGIEQTGTFWHQEGYALPW